MNLDIGPLLAVALIGGLLSGVIASSKGHSFIGYLVIGAVLPIVGIILALVAPSPGKLGQLTPAEKQGWWPDPTGRFEHRYFDGRAWTRFVGRDGRPFEDPL
jgi:hypothetical protein